MAILRESVEVYAKSYFSEAQIQDFLAIIQYWNERSEKSFFQLIQKNEKAVIEFACLVNKTIYDITYAVDHVGYGIVPIEKIKTVILNRDNSSTELLMLASDTIRFFYKATTDQFRKDLEDFAIHIQRIITGEK